MLETGLLLLSLGLILLGAEVFTNAVEWLGRLLRLSDGAVGSVLAAVATALPETMIPVIAIISGKEGSEEIGIGAILGAPFMLGTLAFGVTGLAVIFYRSRRRNFPRLNLDLTILKRDMIFFLVVYSIAVSAAFIPSKQGRLVVAFLLLTAYLWYLFLTFRRQPLGKDHLEVLNPLYLARRNLKPSLSRVLLQIGSALVIIILGAHVFIDVIRELAVLFDFPVFILALIIAPVATELPEKFNSIIWIKAEKDTLALGNITGAMVFQSSLIPALGIAMTNWVLTPAAFTSALLAMMSAGLVYWQIRRKDYLTGYMLLTGTLFYAAFVLLVINKII